MKRHALLLLLLLIAIVPLALVTAQDADTLVIGYASDIDNWNTVSQTLAASSGAQAMVFPILFQADHMTGLPVSGAGLTSWEISEDGRQITFTIREDAVWSDGTPITSQDVKFTYEAINSPAVETTRKNWWDNLESIEIIDDKTLTFNYKQEDCSVWTQLTVRILPSHKFAADFSDFMENPFFSNPDVFGGAFMLDEWAKDEFIRFTANPTYFNGEPNIKTLVYRIMPDAAVRKQALMAGEIDYLNITPNDIEELQTNENIAFYTSSNNTWFNFVFNLADPANPQPGRDEEGNLIEQTPNPFFGDVRVRKAIAMGWNHDDAVSFVGEGAQRIIGTVTPAIPWAYASHIEPYPFDPEAAAALLDEAGWTDSDGDGVRECNGCMYAEAGTPFEFQLDVPNSAEHYINTSQVIQDQLSQLGIKVNLNLQEFPSMASERLYPQIFDAFLVNFTWTQPDPQVLTNIFLSSSNDTLTGSLNLASYVDAEMDDLLARAGSVPGCAVEERAPLYYEIQQKIHDEVISDFISDGVVVIAANKRLQNFELGILGLSNPIEQWTLEG